MRDPKNDLGVLWQRHPGERILVCGLGPSIEELPKDHGHLTIGCNDMSRHFEPDYLVLVDQPAAFNPRTHHRDGALQTILNTKPKKAVVINHGHYERWAFMLRDKGHHLIGYIPQSIPAMANLPMPRYKGNSHWHIHSGGGGSPLTAASLAGFMGASSIGVIGCDWYDHPRMKPDRYQSWSYAWDRLRRFLNERNIEIVCLSEKSRMCKYVERMALDDWLAGKPSGQAQGFDGDRAGEWTLPHGDRRARVKR